MEIYKVGKFMSKWGIEEKETLDTIDRIGYSGHILNLAAADGRFNNKLLEYADKVTTVDLEEDTCYHSIKGNFLIISGKKI